ncbi:hypothetical protein JYT16_02600 [Gemmatimonas aurantiaca]|nr:hypothetical protein [Gemmatimonas aurantiaca]
MSPPRTNSIPLALCTLAVGLILLGSSCRGGMRTTASAVEEQSQVSGKVLVDAYLLDAKIREGGHLRSVRIQVFYADTIALITAKGYLGKGVAKGLWRADSSLFYFPTENEFYQGPLDKLTALDCLDTVHTRSLQQFLPNLLSTDPLEIAAIVGLEIIEQSEKTLEATMKLGECSQLLALEFDSPKKNGRFYLRKLEYRSAEKKKLFSLNRRTLKAGSYVKKKKFTLTIPDDATQMFFD